MTQANDSVLVTPGSGATIATHLVNSKEHQVVMLAGAQGNIYGTADTFIAATGNSANVAAARTTHFDLFNASGSGKILEVVGLLIIPTLTAVTGIGMTWELIKTSAVGTGGTAVTPRAMDSANAALPAGITARSKPTGGATTNFVLSYPNTSSEETSPYAGMASILNHLAMTTMLDVQPLTLREGEGIKLDQTTNSAVGSTNIQVVFIAK